MSNDSATIEQYFSAFGLTGTKEDSLEFLEFESGMNNASNDSTKVASVHDANTRVDMGWEAAKSDILKERQSQFNTILEALEDSQKLISRSTRLANIGLMIHGRNPVKPVEPMPGRDILTKAAPYLDLRDPDNQVEGQIGVTPTSWQETQSRTDAEAYLKITDDRSMLNTLYGSFKEKDEEFKTHQENLIVSADKDKQRSRMVFDQAEKMLEGRFGKEWRDEIGMSWGDRMEFGSSLANRLQDLQDDINKLGGKY